MAEELVSLGTDTIDLQFQDEEIRTALENDGDLDIEEIDRTEQTGGKNVPSMTQTYCTMAWMRKRRWLS